jgi:hypothetical protein
MDFEALQAAWRSSANAPSAAATDYVLREASATLGRRRKAWLRLLSFAALMLIAPIALLAIEIVSGRGEIADLSREWALIPLTLIPFAILVLIARRYGQHMSRHPAVQGSLLEAFRALLDENGAARLRTYLVGGAMLLFVPVLGFMLTQLGATGKMEPEHILQASVLMGAGLTGGAIALMVRYLSRLVPERRHLIALIRQYEQT